MTKKPCKHTPGLRIGSICTGYNAAWVAIEKLGLADSFTETFACDIDPKVRAILKHNFPALDSDSIFSDITQVAPSSLPKHDFLTAGFPCQTFSSAGLGAGEADKSRGSIAMHIVKHLSYHKPRGFLLENVSGLVKRHNKTFNKIVRLLRSIKTDNGDRAYKVMWALLNSQNHGLPQNRERVFIVGLRTDALIHEFCWPAPVPVKRRMKLNDILDKGVKPKLPSSKTALRNILTMMKRIKDKGGCVGEEPVGDISASKTFGAHLSYGVSPCLTRSRCATSGYFLFSHKRMMLTSEMFRLQGVPADRIKCPDKQIGGVTVTEHQLAAMIGNAFDVNLVARLFARIFYSIGAVPNIIDSWGTGGITAEDNDD